MQAATYFGTTLERMSQRPFTGCGLIYTTIDQSYISGAFGLIDQWVQIARVNTQEKGQRPPAFDDISVQTLVEVVVSLVRYLDG